MVISFAQAFWLFKGMQFDHVDSGLQGYINFSQFFNGFFVWGVTNYTGLITPIGSSINFIFYLFNALLFILAGWTLGTELFYGLLIAIGNLSLFFLLYMLLEDKPVIARVVAGSFAMVFFSFYTAINNGPGYELTGVFLPATILFAYLLAKNLDSNMHKEKHKNYVYTILSLFTISAALLFAAGGAAYIIQNIITIAFPIVFLALLGLQKHRKELFIYYIIGIFLATIIVVPIFWSGAIFTNTVGNTFFNSGSLWIIYNLNRQNIFTSLQLYSQSGANMPYYIFELALIVFVIASLFSINKKDRLRTAIILGSFVSLFLIVFIWDNFGAPFGQVFNFLLSHFNELLVFRYSGSSLYYCIFFLYSVLGGIGIGSIYESLKEMRSNDNIKKLLLIIFVVFIASLALIRLYYSDYINYVAYTGISIPGHVYNLSNYINAQNGNFNVALLPVETPFMQFDSWYVGVDIYTYLINNPSFTGGYVAAQEQFFPPSQGEYYNVGSGIDSANLNGNELVNELGVLGIRYIVVQGDSLHEGDMGAFSFNNIYKNLDSSKSILFMKKFGNSSIYENSNYVPLVYASDVDNIGNASTAEIFDVIGNKTFNIQNTSVYSTSIDGFYNDSSTINARRISDFSQPNITFVQNTPTKVTVRVHNATTPYYLVFRETYDPHWAAFYSNGTEVNPYDHIAVNGFANAWYMNKTGSYTVTLYYTLQTDAWIAWAVSFIALGVTVAIGVYGWMERGE